MLRKMVDDINQRMGYGTEVTITYDEWREIRKYLPVPHLPRPLMKGDKYVDYTGRRGSGKSDTKIPQDPREDPGW